MANRYGNIDGTRRINETYTQINEGFNRVQADVDAGSRVADEIKKSVDIQKARVDTLVINGDSSPAAAEAAIDTEGVNHGTLNNRLGSDFNKLNEQLADTGVSTLGDLHMVFQYNYENDPARLKRLKAMGINTIILPYHVAAWQRDVARVRAFITRNNEYGLYTILEADTAKLIGDSYQSELDFLTQMDDLPGLIGYYTLDEPVWKYVPIADQVLSYTRMKTITSKNIFISEVPLLTGRETRFQTYYTPDSYDMYIINTYFGGLTNEDIVTNIVKSVTNFHRYGFDTPKNIIANFPFFSESAYPYPATETTTRAHIDGWKAFFTGNYAVFAHDLSAFATNIDTNEEYQKYVGIIATSLKTNDVGQPRHFLNGLNVAGKSYLESTDIAGRVKITLGSVGDAFKLIPEDDDDLTAPIIYGGNSADTRILWSISRGGTATVKHVVATDANTSSPFPGGVTIGVAGSRLKKYSVSSSTLSFGTINANSAKEMTMPLLGAVKGDGLLCNALDKLPDGILPPYPQVTSNDTVTITLRNVTGANIAVPSNVYYVDSIKR